MNVFPELGKVFVFRCHIRDQLNAHHAITLYTNSDESAKKHIEAWYPYYQIYQLFIKQIYYA
jgi:hypothetical protein